MEVNALSLEKLMVPMLALLLSTSCAGADPREADHGNAVPEGVPQQSPSPEADLACLARARSAERLIARSVVPSLPDGGALVCRYRNRDRELRLDGELLVDVPRARAVDRAYRHRSRAMVDCQPMPALPLFAVLDRDAAGSPRIVTVDLSFCATIIADSAGRQEFGLATTSHRALLVGLVLAAAPQ